VPEKFLLDPVLGIRSGDLNNANDAASVELAPVNNTTGRQANRGMEGLAITPDGRMLVGIMQNALIQDNGLNPVVDLNTVPGRRGLNNRILTVDLWTGETHEYVYTMDSIIQGRGVNEILAINNHEFLALERDNRSQLANLPEKGTDLAALHITPVPKVLFLDLLKDAYKVNGTQTIKDVIAEKVEGLRMLVPMFPPGQVKKALK
jgi:hypothetical protein